MIMAEGNSMTSTDKIYNQIGVYISRIRGVNYDKMLSECRTECELRSKFDFIFNEKWSGHIGYAHIPRHFYDYLDFLRYLRALEDRDEFEGLEDVEECDFLLAPGRYEERFYRNGKLSILAHPVLIRRLRLLRDSASEEELVDECRRFYPFAESMQDADWQNLLNSTFTMRKRHSNSTTLRNIAITLPDVGRKVYEGNKCFEIVARLIGFQTLLKCNIKHKGHRLLTRTVPASYKASFKDVGDGLFLNVAGTSTDKYKTLRILDSMYRIGINPEISNEKSTTSTGARRGRPPKSAKVNADTGHDDSPKPSVPTPVPAMVIPKKRGRKPKVLPSPTPDASGEYNMFEMLSGKDRGDY